MINCHLVGKVHICSCYSVDACDNASITESGFDNKFNPQKVEIRQSLLNTVLIFLYFAVRWELFQGEPRFESKLLLQGPSKWNEMFWANYPIFYTVLFRSICEISLVCGLKAALLNVSFAYSLLCWGKCLSLPLSW